MQSKRETSYNKLTNRASGELYVSNFISPNVRKIRESTTLISQPFGPMAEISATQDILSQPW